MTGSKLVYSVGDCPVCPGFGPVLALVDPVAQKPVFYCPACGTAWLYPPRSDRVDEISAIKELAPAGVVLPSEQDLKNHGVWSKVTRVVNYSDWDDDLDRILR